MARVQGNCGFSLSSLEEDKINEIEEITKYLQASKVNQCHLSIHPSSLPLYHALRNVCFCTSGMQILMSKCYVV